MPGPNCLQACASGIRAASNPLSLKPSSEQAAHEQQQQQITRNVLETDTVAASIQMRQMQLEQGKPSSAAGAAPASGKSIQQGLLQRSCVQATNLLVGSLQGMAVALDLTPPTPLLDCAKGVPVALVKHLQSCPAVLTAALQVSTAVCWRSQLHLLVCLQHLVQSRLFLNDPDHVTACRQSSDPPGQQQVSSRGGTACATLLCPPQQSCGRHRS